MVEEAEPGLLSVLDLLSDDAAGLDSALPPAPFEAPSVDADSFAAGSFAGDSEPLAFLRASDG